MPSRRLFWWLNPSAAMIGLHLPLLVVAFLLPESAYSQLWRTPKYFDNYTATLSALMILVWLLGFLLARREQAPTVDGTKLSSQAEQDTLKVLFSITFILTLAGYVAMVATAVSRGLNAAVLLAALQGQKNAMPQLKEVYFATIPGLTTLTQFGPAAGIFGILLARNSGWRSIRRRAYLLLALTALRAFFVSERLALLEVVTPAAIVAFRFIRIPLVSICE